MKKALSLIAIIIIVFLLFPSVVLSEIFQYESEIFSSQLFTGWGTSDFNGTGSTQEIAEDFYFDTDVIIYRLEFHGGIFKKSGLSK